MAGAGSGAGCPRNSLSGWSRYSRWIFWTLGRSAGTINWVRVSEPRKSVSPWITLVTPAGRSPDHVGDASRTLTPSLPSSTDPGLSRTKRFRQTKDCSRGAADRYDACRGRNNAMSSLWWHDPDWRARHRSGRLRGRRQLLPPWVRRRRTRRRHRSIGAALLPSRERLAVLGADVGDARGRDRRRRHRCHSRPTWCQTRRGPQFQSKALICRRAR